MKHPYLFILLALALLSSPLQALAQASYTVTATTDDGTGQAGSLSQAILFANVDAVDSRIIFSVSSVTLTGALPAITQSLTILGASTLCPATATGGTTIQRASTAPAFRILLFEISVQGYIQDLTLADGRLTGANGAGVSARTNSRLTINRCYIRDCTTTGYGGALSSFGYMDISNSMIVNNQALFDGGIYLSSPSSAPVNRINNLTFLNNASNSGNNSGAMIFFGGELLMENTTLSQNNVAGGADAALYVSSNSNNSVPASATLNHVTVYETNSTKPALRTYAFASAPGTLLLMNSLVVSPYPIFREGGTILSGGGNVFSSGIGSAFVAQSSDKIDVGAASIDIHPLAANGECTLSHAIGCSSVAVNAGISTTLTTDQRGLSRVGAPDAGSYESQIPLVAITQQPPSASLVCTGSTVSIPLSVSGTGPYTYQLIAQNGAAIGSTQNSTPLALTATLSGSYSVVITGGCNSVTSTAFNLTVTTPVDLTLTNDGPLNCTNRTMVSLTATSSGQGVYAFSGPGLSQGGATNTANVSQVGVYSVMLTSTEGCTSTASTTITATQTPPTPFVATQSTPDGLVVQVSGGVQYERIKAIDRVNGYEIRQTEQNQTGYFLITQLGPYAITVIGANGCRAMVTGTR